MNSQTKSDSVNINQEILPDPPDIISRTARDTFGIPGLFPFQRLGISNILEGCGFFGDSMQKSSMYLLQLVIYHLFCYIYNIICYICEVLILNNILENYLKKNIDKSIHIQPWGGKQKLPMFLLEIYDFYQTVLLGQHCILIMLLNESPGINVIKKHILVINKTTDENLVFLYKSISLFRRKSLIEHRIPFVVENGQMYLPFLGMDLRMIIDIPAKGIDTFSSSTQMTFLYFLYHKGLRINATKLADILQVSNMTASRILTDLYTTGLLTYEISGKTGRSKVYKRIGDTDYYLLGSRYLKNPIQRTIYIDRMVSDLLVAGLEALSMVSMLNPPKNSIRAISKKRLNEVNQYLVQDRDRIADEKHVELQVWNYDPLFLSNEPYVDHLSLALTLKEIPDERVVQAMEKRLKDEKWYTG